ncbi:MAG: 50S ribosomal protein L9 [Treponema sp.]|jgi:large subunit ribosomal protein L9|nr:50S ribosomal protein L9 [Treponema sp.]
MKVILNKDLSTLGEEGDVKDVAKGYARNYLFPKGIALPYNEKTIKLFEVRKEEIEARKAQKRHDALGLKEKLETLELPITMPAGANGRLYGAVTGQTIVDELAKQGYQIERKRIEIAGNSFKSVGKYKVSVRLYENSSAEIQVTVLGQSIKTETPQASARPGRRRREEAGVSRERAAEENSAAREESPESAGGQTEAAPQAETALRETEPSPEAASPESAG